MRLEDLMERAAQYDENLARDIKDYVHGRKYGLVYEASKPEFVRMWKKPVVRGDIVNILPPRGVMEDTKNEDDPSEIVYKVIAISDGVASLRIDSIAASGFGASRSKMSSMIDAEKLKLNWQTVKSASQMVKQGDIISIRGRGRLEVAEVRGTTKKGRTVVLLKRYL